MTNDRDPERLLSRYRPAGPPDHLRARVVGTVARVRTWPWLAAAAALLAVTAGFHAASRTGGAATTADPGAEVRATLIEILGGGERAASRVEILLAAQEARQEAAASADAAGREQP